MSFDKYIQLNSFKVAIHTKTRLYVKGSILNENSDTAAEEVGGYLADVRPEEWLDIQMMMDAHRNIQPNLIKTSGSIICEHTIFF